MASQSRQEQGQGQGLKGRESSVPLNQYQPVLSVAPLNSAPCVDLPVSNGASPSPNVVHMQAMNDANPVIVIPSFSSTEEGENLTASTTKISVEVTGSAAMGNMGPCVGLVDIGLCEDLYFFRVSLPGVARDEHFSCVIEPSGKVLIKGVTTTGAKVICRNSQVFRMLTQNLCPPGHFTISFQLPGPVKDQQFSCDFRSDGILEGRVKKR